MTRPQSAFIPSPREAAIRLARGVLLVALCASAVIGGCLAANRNTVQVVNTSHQPITDVTLSANTKDIYQGALQPTESATTSFSVLLDAEYVVQVTYADGSMFHQTIGSLDPFSGSSGRLEIGDHTLTLNGRITKRGSSPPRLYPGGEYR
ncbi:MAG TPA: hypothetical protein VNA69_10115 [Thermoanaerobaculia bacterium]|nr:hypothetical protein [Thermoanaerobaculia bacterium]